MVHAPVQGRFRVRDDRWGDGHFGKSRGHFADGSKKFHDGADIVVLPNQIILSPISGKVVKIDYPYASDLSWKGVQIENSILIAEVWYVEPDEDIVGREVIGGLHRIGRAQNISQKYGVDPDKGLMTPHVHFRLSLKPMSYMVQRTWGTSVVHVDPIPFICEEG